MSISRASFNYQQEDFLQAVNQGLVEGHSIYYIHSYSDAIGATQGLIMPSGEDYTFSDTPSELYLTSDNDSDTQNVVIEWLDATYGIQKGAYQLQGHTPVSIGVGLRVNDAFTSAILPTLGSVFISNALTHTNGTPTAETTLMCYAPGPQTRAMALFTVPSGHKAYGVKGFFSASKGKDVDFFWNTRNPNIPIPPINTNVLSVYQNTVEVDFGYTPIQATSDAWFTAVSPNGTAKVSARIIVVLVDDEFV